MKDPAVRCKYIYFNAKYNTFIFQCTKTWPYIDEMFNVYYIGEL